MLVDSHCHLDFLESDTDLAELIERANTAGVARMVTISTKLSTFPHVRQIAEKFECVYCTVGVHPHEAGEEGVDVPEDLIDLAQHEKVVGIGETGLDYYYEHSPRQEQTQSFRAHIAAARESGLPLIVHTRDADEDTISIMQQEYEKGAYPGVIHCFTAGPELAKAALDLGFYISLSGIVTFNNAKDLREIVKSLPLDRILVETDSPYLAPVPMRGKRNEPAFVKHTASYLAEFLGFEVEEFAAITNDNFFNLFAKVLRPEGMSA
ncbi:MAG: TatD family hydrolase [Kiloniellales bacterium]|nr:TatD family hydrolase [Kiloniellales bacterium]